MKSIFLKSTGFESLGNNKKKSEKKIHFELYTGFTCCVKQA